jgi:hypothetical protein
LRAFSPSAGWPSPTFGEGVASPVVLAVASASPTPHARLGRRARRLAVLAGDCGLSGMAADSANGGTPFQRLGRGMVAAQAMRGSLSDGPDMLLSRTRTVRGRCFLVGSHYISCE